MIGDVDMDTAMFIDTDSDGRDQKNGDSVKTENLVEPGVGGEAVHNPAHGMSPYIPNTVPQAGISCIPYLHLVQLRGKLPKSQTIRYQPNL